MSLQFLLLISILFLSCMGQVIKASREDEIDNRPKLIISQEWKSSSGSNDMNIFSEEMFIDLEFIIYNAGTIEAKDITLELPKRLFATSKPTIIEIPSLGAGEKIIRSVTIEPKLEVSTISVQEATSQVKYHSRNRGGLTAIKEYQGLAIPSKPLIILTPSEYHTKTSKHWFEWFVWVCISFGAGVGIPASKLYELEMATIKEKVTVEKKKH
jgi:hypothetical protein